MLCRVPLLAYGNYVKAAAPTQRIDHRYHLVALLPRRAVAQRHRAVDEVVLHIDNEQSVLGPLGLHELYCPLLGRRGDRRGWGRFVLQAKLLEHRSLARASLYLRFGEQLNCIADPLCHFLLPLDTRFLSPDVALRPAKRKRELVQRDVARAVLVDRLEDGVHLLAAHRLDAEGRHRLAPLTLVDEPVAVLVYGSHQIFHVRQLRSEVQLEILPG